LTNISWTIWPLTLPIHCDNSMWIKTIIQMYIWISSLPYRFNVNTLDNGRSNDIQIDHSVKIINHNRYSISREFHKSIKYEISKENSLEGDWKILLIKSFFPLEPIFKILYTAFSPRRRHNIQYLKEKILSSNLPLYHQKCSRISHEQSKNQRKINKNSSTNGISCCLNSSN